jgi:hypothetical protein
MLEPHSKSSVKFYRALFFSILIFKNKTSARKLKTGQGKGCRIMQFVGQQTMTCFSNLSLVYFYK